MGSARSSIHRCTGVGGMVLSIMFVGSCGGSNTSTEVGTGPATSIATASSVTAPLTSTPTPSTSMRSSSVSTVPPAPDTAASTTSEADTTDTEDVMPTTPEPSVPDGALAGDLVRAAIADLAARTDADPAGIDVVSAEEVDWPDGSIGCPQPGMVYTQAIVNGTKIVLRHDGTDYAYHQGGGRSLFHCPPTDDARTTSPPPGDLDL